MCLPDKVGHTQGIQHTEGVGPECDGAAFLSRSRLSLEYNHWDAHLRNPP